MAEVLELDPVALADVEVAALESALVSWSSTIAASEFRWLRLVAEYDRRRLYERWGCRTCAQWLMWHCSLDLRAAHEKVRVARALEGLPIVAAAFARGELSYSKVRAVTRVAHPTIEQGLVDTAKSIHTAGLESIVAGIRRARVSNNPDRPDVDPGERRFVRSRTHEDGTVTMTIRLPAEEHAVLVKAIDAATEPDRNRGIEQRRADALLAVAARSLAATSKTISTADRYHVVVRVDADVLTGENETGENETGECHLDDGNAISAETARRLCCDGSVIRLYETVDGRPVAVTAKTRTVPAAMRKALHARDRTCRFPGCTHRGWLDAHHRQHWAHGGRTSLDNLLLLCRAHHRAVHEGGWTIARDDHGGGRGGWRFTHPDGWSPHRPPHCEPHAIDLGLPADLDPHAVRPQWTDRPHYPYIISVFADATPDPRWN